MLGTKKLSLEEELQSHEETFEYFFELIERFKVSVQFMLDKFNAGCYYQLSDSVEVFYHYLGAVNKEMQYIIDYSKKIIDINDKSLLPVSNKRVPINEFDTVLVSVNIALEKITDLREAPYFHKYNNLGQEIFNQVILCNHMYMKKELIEDSFWNMFKRYKEDNTDSINYYVEEIDSVAEAKKNLREKYEDCLPVEVWKQTGRNASRTIEKLRKANCVELDLLPLFDYIHKYETLQQLPPDPVTPAIQVNTQKVEIAKADDIITEGGTKNVNNTIK